MAADDGLTVALDTTLDDELVREARVLGLIRSVNEMRKNAGLALTDRIVLTLPAADADLAERHGDWIKRETLAIELRVDAGIEAPAIAKSG